MIQTQEAKFKLLSVYILDSFLSTKIDFLLSQIHSIIPGT